MPKGVYKRTKRDVDLVERKKLIDTKDDFYYLDPLKNIPEEYWNEEIWIHIEYNGAPLKKELKNQC